MARVQEDVRPLNIETDSIIDEYRSRISQALEKEKRKLIEQAERESQDIVARAQQEAGGGRYPGGARGTDEDNGHGRWVEY